jgi:hypothetical protein
MPARSAATTSSGAAVRAPRRPCALEEAHYAWDDGHLSFYATVLSRLIHDNGHSLEYAARIVDHQDGVQQVIPFYAPGFVATYRLRRDRDCVDGCGR